jgi:tungstate transport system permease protein
MIVGGNIAQHTRTLTTAIALETSKGDLALSLSLGIVLLSIVLLANIAAHFLKSSAERKYG